MDVPKWPSISYYINKLNGEKCSPNRQQLVITVMLQSRRNNQGSTRDGQKSGDNLSPKHKCHPNVSGHWEGGVVGGSLP